MSTPFSKFIAFLFDKNSIEDIDESYKKILITFVGNLLLKSPHATYLFNKYCNDVYDTFTPDQIISFIKDIVKIKNMSYQDFHIAKTTKNDLKEKLQKYLIEKYDIVLNQNEISFLFALYKNNIIDLSFLTDDKTTEVKKVDENDEIVKAIKEFEKEVLNQVNDNKKSVKKQDKCLIKTVSELSEHIKRKIEEQHYCFGCPLFGKEIVILDANREKLDEIDVIVLGLNPGVEEVKQNKPFVGDSGKLLRKYLDKYFDQNGIGYLITNVILCHTPNQKALKGIEKKVIEHCKYFDDIIEIVKPKLIVGFGDIVRQALSIKGKISEVVGIPLKYKDKYDVMLNIHPSSVLRNKKKNLPVFENTFEKIYLYLCQLLKNKASYSVKNINSIDEIPENETFLDVKVLEESNEFLIIMIDKDGNKKYYKMPFKTEVFISKTELPHFCHYIEDKNNLTKVIIDDYDFYLKLKALKNKEIKNIIENCSI